MVNGVAYPTLTVDPKAYRVRFLNGANDRYWNLSLFVADDQQPSADGRNNTEVKMIPEQVGINGLSNMNPVTGEIFVGTGYHYPKVTIAGEGGNGTGATASAVVNSAGEITYLNLLKRGSGYVNPTVTIVDYASAAERAAAEVDSTVPATGTGTGAQGFAFSVARPEGIPDPSTAGPDIIQFANEAGFLPKPVLHKAGPVTLDFAGTEVSAGFYLGGAERADTVIDFSQYAGKTLILYNDSTAPVPGGDPRYDYFTGNPDQTAAGGAPTTQPGYGPNTRTVMQIVVNAGTPASAYDASGNGGALATELPKAYAAVADKHVVGSVDAATGAVTGALPKALDTVNSKLTLADNTVVPLEIKTIHGFTDPNLGRLIAQLGTELPGSNGTPTPLGYIDAPTDIIAAGDTQYWWIKNYDVDNHPMHFHLFNVQVLARLDHATGVMRAPEPNEAGWKETVKNWPGEDVIVALAPKTPALPFGLPNSKRTLDPTLPDGSTANEVLYGQSNADPAATKPVPFAFAQTDLDPFVRSNGKVVIDSTGKPTKNTHYGQASSATIANTPLDFGWEYVWHCHILGHEENDLMRPMVYLPNIVASAAVTGVSFDKATGVLSWTDPTPALDANSAPVGNTKGNVQNEIGFRVERAVVTSNAVVGTFTPLTANSPVVDSRVNTLANATSFKDVPAANTDYQYRVVAVNEAGETISTAVASLAQAPAAATSLTVAALTARTLTLNWVDASSNEEGFSVESSVDNGATWTSVTGSPLLPNVTTLAVTGLLPTTTYLFRVASTKTGYVPQYATVSATTPIELLAPAVTLKSTTDPVSGVVQVAVSWTDTSTGETGYTVERCTGTTAACAKATAIWTMLAPNLAAGSTSYVDTPTTAGTTYVYRVRAINGATLGPVGTSAQVVASPVVAAPTGLLASTATGAVVLTWTDASTNETAFNILRSPQGAGTFVQVGTVAKNIVTFTDATVGSGIAYDYKVVAVYTTTTSTSTSAASNIATVTSPLIAAPVVAANVAAGTMVLNWVDNTNNETAYQITRTDGAGAAVVFTTPNRSTTLKSATGAAVTYTDTTAVPNVAYSYTVKAIVSATAVLPVVVGEPSNSVPATVVMAAPGAPTAALTSATKITVTWADNSNNETGFVVERSTDGATWTKLLLATQAYSVKAGTAATASYVDTLVAPAAPSTYQYRVSAVKQTGTGLAAITTASAAQSAVAVVDYSVPLAPTILPATPGATTTVNVAWTDNATNETGFSVQRATDAAFTKSLSTKTAAGAVTGPTGSYLATGLTAGKVYYFRVAATNAVGTSAYSTAVSITVP
jgi:FtsP/CotA-like multicopper oxidase with cupredoxin domain